MSQRFDQLPPPVPPALAAAYPELLEAHARTAEQQRSARQSNPPMERVHWHLCKVRIITTETNPPFHSMIWTRSLIHSPRWPRLRLVMCLALLHLHLIPWSACTETVRCLRYVFIYSFRVHTWNKTFLLPIKWAQAYRAKITRKLLCNHLKISCLF